MRYISVCLILISLSQSATAAGWQSMNDDYFTRASILPLGKSSIQLNVDYRKFDSKKTSVGVLQPLGISYQQTKKINSQSFQQEYDIQVEQTRWSVGMLHGLTSNWTVGFRLPIVNELSNVSYKTYSIKSNGEKTQVAGASDHNLDNMAPSYQPADQIQVGNLEFVGKYLLSKTANLKTAIAHSVRFPTGEISDTDLLVNAAPVAEGYGIGMGLVVDMVPYANWRTGLRIAHSVNLEDEVKLRGQLETEKKHQRNPGDESEVGVLLEYSIIRQFFVSAGLNYFYKQEDEFSGKDALAEAASAYSEKQTAEIGLGLVPPVRGSQFPVAAQLRYAILLDGKNTEASDVLSVQTSLTF